MALVTLCDNCESDWPVDNLVYVHAANKNLCPVCVNFLLDVVISKLSEVEIADALQDLDNF